MSSYRQLYKIVQDGNGNLSMLELAIQYHLDRGWQLYGPLMKTCRGEVQPMIYWEKTN